MAKIPKHDITPGDWPQTENIIHEIDIEISEIKSQITSNISGVSAAIASQLSIATNDLSSELDAVSQHVIAVDSQLLLIESEAASNDSEILILESEVSNASIRITDISERLDSIVWRNPVEDRVILLPSSPTLGDRYLLIAGTSQLLSVDSTLVHSYCGYGTTNRELTLEKALEGTDTWVHAQNHTHWFILDLGQSYTISKVKGRSNESTWGDPTDVNIYISDDTEDFGDPVVEGISTWQDTEDWVEIEMPTTSGRYIKVEIENTESAFKYLGFGQQYAVTPTNPFSIFDIVVLV